MSRQIRTYTSFGERFTTTLGLQHPEWVQPGGDFPICDSYDARLMELIDALTRAEVERVQESRRYSCRLPSGNQKRFWRDPALR